MFIWNEEREGELENTGGEGRKKIEDWVRVNGEKWQLTAESGGSDSAVRACCIDSDPGLKAKSKCLHSH